MSRYKNHLLDLDKLFFKIYFIKETDCYLIFSPQNVYTTGPSANLKITIAPALKVRFPPAMRIGLGP